MRLLLILLGMLATWPPAVAQEVRALPSTRIQSPPEEALQKIIASANTHLTPFLRPYGKNFSIASGNEWIEISGLRYSRIFSQNLSPADRQNGIDARCLLSLNITTYRHLGKSSVWGPWQKGHPSAFPTSLKIEKRKDTWSVVTDLHPLLHTVNKTPIFIPSAITSSPPLSFSKTPGFPQTSHQKSQPSNLTPSLPSFPENPPPPATLPSPVQAALAPFYSLIFAILCLAVSVSFISIFFAIFRKCQHRRKHGTRKPPQRQRARHLPRGQIDAIETPPPLPSPAETRSTPPHL